MPPSLRGLLIGWGQKRNAIRYTATAAPRANPMSAGTRRGPRVQIPAGFHPQAVRHGNALSNIPGSHGSGMQPINPVPIGAYTSKISSVPLTGGQGQAIVSAAGAAQVTVGPQGIGTTWYPASATVSTTSGVNDTSTCNVYLGPNGLPNQLVGTLFPGGAGVVSLAIPSMQPGWYVIAQWSGAKTGDIAAINIIGTMDALTTG